MGLTFMTHCLAILRLALISPAMHTFIYFSDPRGTGPLLLDDRGSGGLLDATPVHGQADQGENRVGVCVREV